MCLFAQVIPLSQIQRFYTLFWKNGWVLIYRLVLSIFNEHREGMLQDMNEIEIQQRLMESCAMRTAESGIS